MKNFVTLFLITASAVLYAQKTDYNTDKKGFVAQGYDVVSYFTNSEPVEGKKKYQTTYDEATFVFSSEKNLALFKENPTKYIPQYGGYCAYAIAAKKTKMNIDAESYEIRDGKLYLFYSSWFSNKLDDWKNGNTENLQVQGDKNWEELKHQNN
ncbi:YHS domain-containing (seleno)protein [Tenacibaculum tangerinum]|uniref:YHS domain-containing (Seleno)protein n=1 Tax=Tenacibaculum tangerinum TaxID=3038772 RepID=A0ABY8L0H9_9FLAO|nr:YHS domain-containing (seleno)protein [Tenacibaculum tangerinum]WGH74596.1 YHS domain-containing (seleno)protein [Tenacibaculum tangerinum]